ncbi:methyltransferase domain-containing protein [Maricaulis sp.]|uniref:methyltransferase domain-containing protein n=1 Tax=Maricaulis sp. TaxID=1486257 RepID=UPI001B0D6798|nr:methyltransferase domain-containing protein [Maricaulis sp.]MBO6798234.1 methyltransferase domain-containing protein [Maricaulis sp.]
MDWEQRFQENSTPWERSRLHPVISDWASAGVFQPGSRVLIPGCGRSPELVHLTSLGLKVTGFDLSETAIGWQRERLEERGLDAELIAGDAFTWAPSHPIDLIYEQTFLCAIPPALRETYEACAYRWLKPGGGFLALFMQKTERGGPPYACSLEAMHTLFPANRWDWPENESFTPYPHPNLNDKPELAGVLRRR